MKRLFAAALVAAMPLVVHATTYSTDATDLWYIPSERGWGANVVQTQENLFVTFFVYGSDGKPTWYVAPSLLPVSSGSLTFAGDLYSTNGSWFGATWNSAASGNRKVGSATFTLDTFTGATLTYSVDGVQVAKQVVRQPGPYDNYNGSYLGAFVGTLSGCSAGNGPSETPLSFAITQTNATSIKLLDAANCTYTGTYSQAGRMGSFSATGGGSGCADRFDGTEVQGSSTGLTMRVRIVTGNCVATGALNAVRR